MEVLAAKVHGEQLIELPQDLYIPPEALRIFLETFEGPLDLLLYMIKKQNFDILDIPIADITRQYLHYIEIMHELQFTLAAEYLLMAAMLAEIKSRLLLPKPATDEGIEPPDPRAELVRRLQEYERFQQAAGDLDRLPRVDRELFIPEVDFPYVPQEITKPVLSLAEILEALQTVLERAKLYAQHQVTSEVLSVREKMTLVLDRLNAEEFIDFCCFFRPEEGKLGVVVTLIAILELIRQASIELVQTQPFAPIYIRIRSC